MDDKSIKELDALRKEKRDLDYFLVGCGNLRIHKLIKWFGNGQHELQITNPEIRKDILTILENRLEEINKTILEL